MVLLVCPVTREPLEARGDKLIAAKSGNQYPIVDGIPVLLPDEAERRRITDVNWSAPGDDAGSRLGFYNSQQNNTLHVRDNPLRRDAESAAKLAKCAGPTLEIGSGGGSMQGIGAEYLALDYGFTALQKYIDPKHQRVCGTAEALPFPDSSFAFIVSIDALEHVPRADLAFAEIDRVLQPGGATFLLPAWHCRQANCDGVPVLPYRELGAMQKLAKLTLPLTSHVLFRAATTLPKRAMRRAAWKLSGAAPTTMRWKRLRPDYSRPIYSDSDACSSLDVHEASLFFHSHGYDVITPGAGAAAQLLSRHPPLIVRKPT